MSKSFSADRVAVGATDITSGNADPTAGAGVVAPLGSLYLRDDGTLYQKTNTGDTDWTVFTATPAASNPVTDYLWLESFLSPTEYAALAVAENDTIWHGTRTRQQALSVTNFNGIYAGTTSPAASGATPITGTLGGAFPTALSRWTLTSGNVGVFHPYLAGSSGTLTPVTMAAATVQGGWRVKANAIFTGTTPLALNQFYFGVRAAITAGPTQITAGTENNHALLCVDSGGAVKMRTRDTTTQTVGATIVTVAEETAYEFELISVPGVAGKVFYRVKSLALGGAEFTGQVTATLPATAVTLNLGAYVVNNSANSKWGFDCAACKIYR